jgi:hypothetical protein
MRAHIHGDRASVDLAEIESQIGCGAGMWGRSGLPEVGS